MKNKIKNFTDISMFKFIFFIICYFIIVLALKQNIDGQTILQSIVEKCEAPKTDANYGQLLIYKWYPTFRKYALYLFGFGVVLNVITDIVVDKTKNSVLITILGFVKALALAPVTGIMTMYYGIFMCDDKQIITKNKVNVMKTENNYNNNPENKKVLVEEYDYEVPIITFEIAFAEMILIVFAFLFALSLNPFSIILAIVSLYTWFGYPRRSACFKKCVKMTKNDMKIKEIKNIMRNYDIVKTGNNRDGSFFIDYKISSNSEHEKVRFIFEYGFLVEKSIGYRRIERC